ncbi:MAG: tetratricopeptide repeat protein [bacterium]
MSDHPLRGILAIVLLALVVYAPLRQSDFLWDDALWLQNSPVTQAPDGWARAFVEADRFDYYPLTSLAFWAEWRLFGENPLGYHTVNVALHVLGALLLWRLLRRLRVPGAFVVAALFAVHPVAVGSVAWIAELKNTLSFVLLVGALLAWTRSGEEGGAWYGAALGLFVAALLAKASAVVFPAVALALDFLVRGRLSRRDFARIVPFVALAFGSALFAMRLQAGSVIGNQPLPVETFAERLGIAWQAVLLYARKALVPYPLPIVYPQWDSPPVRVAVTGTAIAVVVFAVFAWLARRGRRGPLVAAVVAIVALAPTLGFVPMYYTLYARVADHWAYLALPAFLALIVGTIATWARVSGPTALATGLAVVALAGSTALAHRQAERYRSPETMWQHVLDVDPASWVAHHQVAIIHARRGELEVAEQHFLDAVRLRPDYALAYRNLGRQYEGMQRWGEAAEQYRRAIEVYPEYVEARLNLASALLQTEDAPEALEAASWVMERHPEIARAHLLVGVARAQLDDPIGARQALEDAVRIEPNDVLAHWTLAKILVRLGELEAAEFEVQAVLQLDPSHPEAPGVLAALRQALGESGS